MTKILALLVLLALGLVACAETDRSSGVINRAATCAMCGASVNGGYLYGSTESAAGPGHGWQ